MKTIIYLVVMLVTVNLGVAVAAGSGEKEGAVIFHGVSTFVMKGTAEPGTTLPAALKTAKMLVDPPVITNPNLTLFYAPSNMWQFTQINQGATYTFYVSSGSATLVPNITDCYITTTTGATVCVYGTNSAGSGTPYCFYVPGI